VGKNVLATAGFGPWLVAFDEIPDPSQLTLTTRLNGAEVQRGETADMISSVSQIVSYISAFTRLEPGDVISTGTPGVGMARQPPCGSSPATSSWWRFPASAYCATPSFRKQRDMGVGPAKIARELGMARSSIYRL
jgi:2-keto-4-pentenoate hydratase/2-oxohepta-3-ene-1,7-dioic acid hydratase in catechol pathway